MAIKELETRLDNLYELIFSKDSNDKIRNDFAEQRNLCIVGRKEVARSLMIAWEHYNPIKAQNQKEKSAIAEEFDNFGKDVVKAFKSHLPTKVKGVDVHLARGSNAHVIRFVIEEDDPAGADDIFRDLNHKVVQPLVNSPKYSKYFTEEAKTAAGTKPTGSMSKFQIAHGSGDSVFEARQQVTKDELDSLLGIKSLPVDARAEVRKGIKDFMKLFLESEREVNVKVVEGKVVAKETISLSLQTARENLLDAGPSMSAGKKQKKVIKDLMDNIQKVIKTGSKKWGVRAEGSPSVIELTGSAIVNTPTLKRKYAKKTAHNLTRFKTSPKSISPQKASKTKKFERGTRIIKGGGVTSAMKASGGREKGNETGLGGATDQKDFALQMRHLLKVKRAINQRLPAEVRRNMGKPALTNRSGRFSNSAQVESIIPAAQTLMVKYSYRLNPYETFENTGKKKWPTGYNPKPLIAKSIRGLALGLTDEKLTIRRS
jgi:hypothetical protein